MPNVVLLGSTGSIGTQMLDVIQHLDAIYDVQIIGLSGYHNIVLLAQQVEQFKPQYVWLPNNQLANELLSQCTYHPKILLHAEGLNQLASLNEVDWMINGIVGFAGLATSLTALASGKKLLTANKESIVCAGHLLKPYLSQIIPLDSEHSAIYQCLQGCLRPKTEMTKLFLTASGGPFRELPHDRLNDITPAMALKHPQWQMGNRITIDSATMMNKGFERIEAQVLFDLPYEQIDIVIHPQSIVHSAVAFQDGSIIAQMGHPDMRVPLLYGLSTPNRWPAPHNTMHLDLTQLNTLNFYPVEANRYPCLALANEAAQKGGSALTFLNSVDEVLVQAFIEEKIGWLDIPLLLEKALEKHMDTDWIPDPPMDIILEIDRTARQSIQAQIKPQAAMITA